MILDIIFDPDKLIKEIERENAAIIKLANAAIKESGYLVANTAKKAIAKGGRSGRFYKRGKKVHQASAPGEYPKTDRGGLVSSIKVSIYPFMAIVGSDLKYSRYLEKGTEKNGSVLMEARPWLQPSFDVNKAKIANILDSAIAKALSR